MGSRSIDIIRLHLNWN